MIKKLRIFVDVLFIISGVLLIWLNFKDKVHYLQSLLYGILMIYWIIDLKRISKIKSK